VLEVAGGFGHHQLGSFIAEAVYLCQKCLCCLALERRYDLPVSRDEDDASLRRPILERLVRQASPPVRLLPTIAWRHSSLLPNPNPDHADPGVIGIVAGDPAVIRICDMTDACCYSVTV
jgi:hypothetical protein